MATVATETFRYPRRFKAMTAFSAVVFAALAAMLLKWFEIVPLRQPELFVSIMLTLGVSLTWCVAMYRRADDEVMVDESNVVYRTPGQNPVILAWGDVFTRLRQIVRERTVPPPTAGPPQRVFAKSVTALLLGLHWPIVVMLVWLWLRRRGEDPGYVWVAIPIIWGLWTLLNSPWRVRLLDDAVAVDWLGRSRKIPYADIEAAA